jgi:hypothetical protein
MEAMNRQGPPGAPPGAPPGPGGPPDAGGANAPSAQGAQGQQNAQAGPPTAGLTRASTVPNAAETTITPQQPQGVKLTPGVGPPTP